MNTPADCNAVECPASYRTTPTPHNTPSLKRVTEPVNNRACGHALLLMWDRRNYGWNHKLFRLNWSGASHPLESMFFLEARPYGQTMPAQMHMLHLELVVRRQQTLPFGMSYSTNLGKPKVKSCEVAASSRDGITHATLRPAAACDWSPRQHRLIWVGAVYRLAVAALLPPLRYVASSLGYELDCLVQKLDGKNRRAQALQTMLPKLPKEVLFETFAHAKEELVGASRLGICVLERFELERTDVIGNLGKSIARRRCIAVNNGLLGQCKLDGIMQRLSNQGLPIVVVNLNFIEFLKILEMIEQGDGRVSPDATDRPMRREHVGIKLGFPVCEHSVSEREILKKNAKCREVLLPFLDVHAPISIVAVKQGREVQGDVLQPFSFQSLEIVLLIPAKSITLLMKYKNYEVILGFRAGIAGFVDEYGEILHGPHAPNNKNAGGKPPAVGDPPCGEDHLIYTTRQFEHSILAKYEHMFSIIDTNTCSPYGKAA